MVGAPLHSIIDQNQLSLSVPIRSSSACPPRCEEKGSDMTIIIRHSIDWSILYEAADRSVAVLDLGKNMMGSGTRQGNSR